MIELPLIIDGIPATPEETKELTQDFTDLEDGRSHRRLANGQSCGQVFFYKRKIVLSGEAWVRPSFYGLRLFQSYHVQFPGFIEARSDSPIISLPTDMRPDTPVIGSVQVDREWIPASYKQSGQSLIFDVVEFAEAYRIEYAPQFIATLTEKDITEQTNAPGWDWSLEFEEG